MLNYKISRKTVYEKGFLIKSFKHPPTAYPIGFALLAH